MTDLTMWLEATGALAGAGGLGYAKVRAPRVYWALVGMPVTWGRFLLSYRSTMDVCGLTVQPSGLRAFMTRNVARREVQPVPPKIRRVRGTSTGLRVTLRLPAGLEPADLIATSERLRHAWGVHSVTVVETKPGYVELRMTGYDVLRRVRMPRKARPHDMVVPVALREDGTAFERDYRKAPMALTLGANHSGKSMYQRNLIKGLAQLPVALVGIDCKRGVEQTAYGPRLSALATTPDESASLLAVLVAEMENRFDVLKGHGVSDLWELPAELRPVPVVVLVDEVAELFLISSKKDEERRERIVTALIRLAQMARAVGIYLEICGQRFGSDLGKGATMLRAQLTGRVVHRVNDKQTAEMGLNDVAPDAVAVASLIPMERPGTAVAADASGGWSKIRTPDTSRDEVAAVCRTFAHLAPDFPALEPFRPYVPADVPAVGPSLVKARPVTD
ncbi:DNA segregation ATPase FtsK/SpoIIIE, S-DNA-T family [Streptomyces sp. Ag82_O1-12]|jgi:S-DNA-T family DNA segregation ATPase FtsK/SpoIIIE|uniref:FtsK/SpoIIIE domain-containing protein n=1 Tax=unclassified Streptomyces TaxID=2593676 RepID=UPI000BC43A1E|nr:MULTISPECIES: FtsK/SpoIIIE domain-containing protein [unclassified Streptomyces]SMQ19237.1 DNA segregation ATPase FtsK/SpoIIIE, S-DNA-T family [Streptomyces sp. Ag82_O1-12]SOD48278.1 DNA segregation ATPase FtsK/SpoIIIE, S-DNA-T family [Streptomyces sp. Ag82_G6-1]